MSQPLSVAPGVVHAMQRHGVEAYPEECCGALISIDGVVVESVRLANITDADAARRFTIGPDGYKLAESRARTLGGRLEGFYHSHPDEPARPSQYDLDHAWPNLAYAIISIRDGDAAGIRVWRLRDDRTGFDEGELIWVTGS